MNLSIMQPYFFPYIGYFQLLQASEKFVFYDDVNFIKGGWINRNRILISGSARYITIPLSTPSSFSLIEHTKINRQLPWKKKIFAQITHAYAKSPHFAKVFNLVEETLSSEEESISQLAKNSITGVLNYLGIKKDINSSSRKYCNNHLKGQDRVLDICLQENATRYLNLPGGISLYEPEKFSTQGIALSFIDVNMTTYRQHSANFTPGLSIIDVLMHNEIDEVINMLL
ncbi:WbqC family protein [Comamonas terrigena]|uniref:WbqC family protein n=2 Tax=Comamonas terrigena TaxID=32013 RepID=UPI0024482350|nr:WbqC family protein [Comamonas terrigena]MDH0513211.1 WbqC family protein [Comamonas terrigena]MDH1093144.1 WbqC family protein [Comamonas terrigena]MDH1500622.1 WbqC family protein [Comamonas terrigena]